MEQVDIINRLFEKVAQNQIDCMLVGILNKDGSFEIVISGEASYLEKVGLADAIKDDIKNMVYDEAED